MVTSPGTVSCMPVRPSDAVCVVHRRRPLRDRAARLLGAAGIAVEASVAEVSSIRAPGIVPHVVVVGEPDDIDRLGRDLTELRVRFPSVRLLYLAVHPMSGTSREALGATVDGVIAHDAPGPVLAAAVRAVGVGLTAFDEPSRALLRCRDERGRDERGRDERGAVAALTAESTLSMRERQVLALIATGASNARIAQQLVVSTETVKSHVAHILAKLAVPSRAAAVDRALALGALTPLTMELIR
ncbi:MAG: Response regulator receiver protein [Acidimicrobiaceae bacterium]|nr:MAG: Response regulator receiver protein [Acidimicrobiaceae bacterium]